MRTRFAVWALTLLLLMPLAAGAATLSYSYGTTYSSYNARDLIITATEGGATVWEMRVRVPTSGQTNTTHNYYAAGQIVSFKDVQHGGTAFDYSAEAVANASFGLFDFGGCSDSGISGANATFADTQTAGYYEFTKTTTSLFHMGSVNDPNNVVTTVLTVRINAPTVSGNGHTTSISAGLRLTNNQATTLNLWYSAYCAGQWAMHLNAGTSTGTFVNADSATVKPNVHNTAGTDDHAVYAVSDWYGSKVTTIDGTLVQAVVKNNQAARDRNMRPGMTFAISAPDMATYYSDLANTMYGSTVQTTSGSNYYVNALLRQPGPFGQGVTLAPAASVTMNFAAEIIAPGGQPPVANAGADQIVHDTDRSGDQLVTLDGSASTDADGSIVSYVWKNGETQIATGATPQVLLAAGVHTLTLTVTDDDNLTDSDTVVVTVNAPPIAMAGNDQTVIDSLGNGSVSVALSAAGSTDADGTIVSYVWQDNGVQVATGSAAQVSLAVGEHTMTLIVTDNLGGTDSDTCTVVVNQVHTAGTMVNAPRNDCSASSSSHDYNTSTMYLPYSNDSQQTFLRFRTAIPKGATIVGAYLKVMSNGQAGNTSSSVARVRVLDSDSCDNFTANPYALDVMAGSLDWTLPGTWTDGQWYTSENLASLVQVWIDRPGYEFENYIGLRVSWVSGLWKRIYSYDRTDHQSGPQLEIHWVGPETVLDLWMADPEVRLGQKIYCQIHGAQGTQTLTGKLNDQVFYTKTGQLASEEIVTANYRTLGIGEHTVLIELTSANGRLVASASRTWTKLHDGIGAVNIDENNAICRNGQPFFPLAPWCIETSHFTGFSPITNMAFGQGWNHLKTSSGWGSYLDAAGLVGLPAVGPAQGNYWPNGTTAKVVEIPPGSGNWVHQTQLDLSRVATYVTDNRSKAALFGWCWHDEPDMGGQAEYITAVEVRNWTEVCHALDTEHPHFTTLIGYGYTKGDYPNYSNRRLESFSFLTSDIPNEACREVFAKRTLFTDVLLMDYYPYEYSTYYGSWYGIEDYTLAVDRMQAWNYNLIPTMSWIEVCDIRGPSDPNLNYPWTPAITATQLHHLIWVSIIHNCKGLAWFHYFVATPAENLAVLAQAKIDITALTPAILSSEETVASVVEQEMGGGRIDIMVREYGNLVYIFTANLKTTAETCRFHVDGMGSGEIINVFGESRTITSQVGYFEDSFAGLGVHIYVLGLVPGEPDPALSSLAAPGMLYTDGVRTCPITITVRDGFGNPVVGESPTSIVVSATGSGNTVTQPVMATDANGQTVAYLSSTVGGAKIVTATVRGQQLASSAVVVGYAQPVVLAYGGAELSQVVPGTTNGQTMSIKCIDVIGNQDLWLMEIHRWNASTQAYHPQVRINKFDDLTDGGSFNYTNPEGHGLLTAHAFPVSGLDPASYTELHKDSDYFEYSLTEYVLDGLGQPQLEIVTVYRINPSTTSGTVMTAARTMTNVSSSTVVPSGRMAFKMILADGGYNPRLSSGQLGAYIGATNERHQQMLPGPVDAVWQMFDNLDRADNPAFNAAGMLGVTAVVMNNAQTQALQLTLGRTFALTTDIVAYHPTSAIGDIFFDNRAAYLDGIHFAGTPAKWIGTTGSQHDAGIAPSASQTKVYTLTIDIMSAP